MKRTTDRLAHAAVLALAGYAVRQLVGDVRAMRYVDRLLIEHLTRVPEPARVLPWDEAIKLHATEEWSHASVPHFVLDVRTGRLVQYAPLPDRRWNP